MKKQSPLDQDHSGPASRRTGASVEESESRTLLLDVAERLFASNGYFGVSTRDICSAAGVNPAAVNYHFGTKEKLYESIFVRRIVPLNEARRALFQKILSAPQSERPAVRAVAEAWIRPLFEIPRSHATAPIIIMRFIGQVLSTPQHNERLIEYYDEVGGDFMEALKRAMPELSKDEIFWRYNYIIGSIVFTEGGMARNARLPRSYMDHMGAIEPSESAEADAMERLIQFVTSGLSSPSFRSTAPSSEGEV